MLPVPTEPEWGPPEPDGSGSSAPEAHWSLCRERWPDRILCGQETEGHIQNSAGKEERYLRSAVWPGPSSLASLSIMSLT